MKHFTIEELTRSATAQRLGIENRPSAKCVNNLKNLVNLVLDPAREQLGRPSYGNSGYRCRELNKAVGGARNSYHIQGRAADIDTRTGDNRMLLSILQRLPHTELLWEDNGRWIHVAL